MGRSWTTPGSRHHAARAHHHGAGSAHGGAHHHRHARRHARAHPHAHAHAVALPVARPIPFVAWLALLVALALSCAMLAASVLPARGAEPVIGFRSDGDEIAGWHWLRDPLGRATATWYVHGARTGDPIVLTFTLLATDRASGGPGIDARAWVTVGPLADGATAPATWGPELVTFPNVAPPDGIPTIVALGDSQIAGEGGRQAWNNGAVRGGTCVPDQDGLNDRGEPYVRLIPD